MAGSRWISDLTGATPVAGAARRVLTLRLGAVRGYLGLALVEPGKNPEHVHQLRVSTRRAGAALRIFAACLPEARVRRVRRRVRRVRRAAGSARDWDIFRLALPQAAPFRRRRHSAAATFLYGYATGQRIAGQRELAEAGAGYPFAWDRLVANTLAAVRTPESGPGTLGRLAVPIVASFMEAFDEVAAGDLRQDAHLHQVRIAGKRLRYAMEIFADCFEPAFRDVLYPAVEEMQEILGYFNDSRVACQHLNDLAALPLEEVGRRARPIRAGIQALREYHAENLERERDHFHQWWQQWRALGDRAQLTVLLKPLPRPRATRRARSPRPPPCATAG